MIQEIPTELNNEEVKVPERVFVFKTIKTGRRGKPIKTITFRKKESALTKADLDIIYGDFKVQWDKMPLVCQHRFIFDIFAELEEERKHAIKEHNTEELPIGHA